MTESNYVKDSAAPMQCVAPGKMLDRDGERKRRRKKETQWHCDSVCRIMWHVTPTAPPALLSSSSILPLVTNLPGDSYVQRLQSLQRNIEAANCVRKKDRRSVEQKKKKRLTNSAVLPVHCQMQLTKRILGGKMGRVDELKCSQRCHESRSLR